MIYSEGNSLVVIQWLGLHSLTRAQVQSLDGELRSHKPSSAAKKKKKPKTKIPMSYSVKGPNITIWRTIHYLSVAISY